MTSPAEEKIVSGGLRIRRGWGGNAGSINTDTNTNTNTVCPRAAVSSRTVLGRVSMTADTGSHTQQPLTTVGDVTILEHFVRAVI